MADVYVSPRYSNNNSVEVQCLCLDILQLSKTWLTTVHVLTLPKRGLRALNFVPLKSTEHCYLGYPEAVLHV